MTAVFLLPLPQHRPQHQRCAPPAAGASFIHTPLCVLVPHVVRLPPGPVRPRPRRYRDPTLPIHRTEITRFPHAILEIKLALPEGQQAPEWVRDLMDSGLITEVGAPRREAPAP